MTAPSLPPRRIYLLRHAQAGWAKPGESDFDRALDEKGKAEASVIAGMLAGKGYLADRIVSSAALRCRQTAETVSRAFGTNVSLVIAADLYHGMTDTYLGVIAAENETGALMIVGHNPTVEELLETLVGPDVAWAAIPGGYPTAGLAVIDRGSEDDPLWTLTDFIVP